MLRWIKNLIFPQACVCEPHERTLKDISVGESATIDCLRGDASVCQRLREMGFCESADVKKIADSGALICKVCDAKVILSKKLAGNIIVKDICTKDSARPKKEGKVTLLSRMKVGERGVIKSFVFDSEDCERVEEMGITPGEAIEVVRYAPLGDPIEVKIRGYLLSLRKEEADLIEVNLSS